MSPVKPPATLPRLQKWDLHAKLVAIKVATTTFDSSNACIDTSM